MDGTGAGLAATTAAGRLGNRPRAFRWLAHCARLARLAIAQLLTQAFRRQLLHFAAELPAR